MNGKQVPLNKFLITKQLTKRPEDYPDAKNQPHVQVALRRKAAGLRNGTMQVHKGSLWYQKADSCCRRSSRTCRWRCAAKLPACATAPCRWEQRPVLENKLFWGERARAPQCALSVLC